jgi:NAD(P)-dependent dehydrogenase (short-subunit alcohol dehydrogenase family)
MKPLEQQTMLITGATDGLGKQIAEAVATSGANVLLHGRNKAKLSATLQQIRLATGNDRLTGYVADFSSLPDVSELAKTIRAEHERLDVLVNNAAVGFALAQQARELSKDGYELRFAVNYLAPFLLTCLLRQLLVQSAPARIVNVCSARQEAIDFDDVLLERGFGAMRAYRQSKLALIMHTFDLAGELWHQGVTANCLHPATFMPTKLVLDAGITPVSSVEQGLRATMRLIAEPSLDQVTGRYFNGTDEADAHPQAYDLDARGRLRQISARLVRLPRMPDAQLQPTVGASAAVVARTTSKATPMT